MEGLVGEIIQDGYSFEVSLASLGIQNHGLLAQ